MVAPVVFAVLSLAAAGLAPSVNGLQVCTPYPAHVYGHFEGFPGVSTNSSSPDACSAQCANSNSCAAYHWSLDDWALGQPISTCHELEFRASFTPSPFTNPPGFVVDSFGRCGTQLPTSIGDIAGNDLKNVAAKNVVECSFQCEDTPGCHAYSWSAYDGGKCWMKTTRTAVLSGPFDGSVISGEPFKCSIMAVGVDIVGRDMGSVARVDWRACCGVCRRTAGCVASSWSDYNGGTCWLKNAVNGGAFKHAAGVRTMLLR